jgi:hypothetical protein
MIFLADFDLFPIENTGALFKLFKLLVSYAAGPGTFEGGRIILALIDLFDPL